MDDAYMRDEEAEEEKKDNGEILSVAKKIEDGLKNALKKFIIALRSSGGTPDRYKNNFFQANYFKIASHKVECLQLLLIHLSN